MRDCLAISIENDKICFPEEMWMSKTEIELLLASEAESTILRHNDLIIGQAITLPESFVQSSLREIDALFQATETGIYSYSEAIRPEFQNKGYGSLLIREIAIRMKEKGFERITAHVRTRYGWHMRRRHKLHVATRRTVDDFWTDPRDKTVEYQLSPL